MGSPSLPGNTICQPLFINPFTFILQRKSLGLTLTAIGLAPIIPYWIMPMGIFVYLRASRLPFLTGSLLPVAVATALAYLTDHTWNFLFFGLTALGVAALQVGANLINDYYDSFGSDPLNRNFTPFSGGSRVIQDGRMSPVQVRTLAYLMLGLGVGCGLGLIYLGRPWVALASACWVWRAALFYSASPVQLMSGGLGEILIFLAFGPLLTWGAYYVQTGKLSLVGAAVSLPLAFLITAIIWINEFPDLEADLAAGKHHLVARLGLQGLPLGLCRPHVRPVCQSVRAHGNIPSARSHRGRPGAPAPGGAGRAPGLPHPAHGPGVRPRPGPHHPDPLPHGPDPHPGLAVCGLVEIKIAVSYQLSAKTDDCYQVVSIQIFIFIVGADLCVRPWVAEVRFTHLQWLAG